MSSLCALQANRQIPDQFECKLRQTLALLKDARQFQLVKWQLETYEQKQ